jgi:type IV pilus assembly protein PilF
MRLAVVVLAMALLMAACVSTSTTSSTPANMPQSRAPASTDEETARNRARVHTELAAGYYELRNMAVALDEINQALKAEPGYGPAYNVAGLIYAELREDRLAQENFQRALRIDPLDPDANNNYGRFLCDRKQESEAIKYFLTALRNPLYQAPERSYVNAGLCSRRQGHVAAAEDYFMKALQARPTQPQALYQLADISYQRGNYAQAKNYLVRVEKLANPSAETLWLALRIERKLGDRNAEASYGQQLRRQFPDSKEARALLAGVYE